MFSDCWHPVINGVVTSIDILKTRLEMDGHEVDLYVPGKPGLQEADPRVHRFFSVTAPFHRESRFSLPHPWSNVNYLMRHRPDVIHIHTPFNLGLLAQWAADKLKVPFVFTHHTLWEEYVHYVPLLSKRMLRKTAIDFCRNICNRSAGVIAPSEEVRDRLLEQGVRQPIEVIPTGIDVELFEKGDPQPVREALGIPPDAPVAVYAGRMGKEKSLDFLLDAFALVAARLPGAHLLMLGGGPEKAALEDQARSLGLADRVHFTGYVKRSEMVNYFKAARVFVFASTTETQGLVSLEAQASGIPVAAVRASGSSEAVAHDVTGFLVPQDKEAFAAHALRLLEDDVLQQRMAEAALARAWSFSSRAMAERSLALYQRAAQTRPGPSLAAVP